jgi:hypothetical protein
MGLLASALAAFCTLILAIIPAANLPGASSDDRPPFPAPRYLLPWMGGDPRRDARGEPPQRPRRLRLDFDLNYDIVAGARGRVMAPDSTAAAAAGARRAANYALIDHGDARRRCTCTSHLRPLVLPGQFVDQARIAVWRNGRHLLD